VRELVKEVLGPRNGINEIITNPMEEYITGVLAPAEPENDVEDGDYEINGGGGGEEAEEYNEPPVSGPLLSTSVMDPKKRAQTMGISFELERKADSKFEVCLTWAIYKRDPESSVFKRFPIYKILDFDAESSSDVWMNSTGGIADRSEAFLSLHSVIRVKKGNTRNVHLYLVNRNVSRRQIGLDETSILQNRVELHIFQPQIRIKLHNCDILSLRKAQLGHKSPSEEIFDFQYRDEKIYAKGHMCSAIWKEADHESKIDLKSKDSEDAYFMWWEDSSIVPEEQLVKFLPADIRTEFVPLSIVEGSSVNVGNMQSGALSASTLANALGPTELESMLKPILHGYRDWIDEIRNSESFPEDESKIKEIIGRHEESYLRISRSIELILGDEDVRLSFCFSNKAMDLQRKWSEGDGLKWRPFQLAFILTVLESMTSESSEFRELCDLLWVPTGGGKTEAYLGLMAFALAYRRRKAISSDDKFRGGAGITSIIRYTLRLLAIQQFRRITAMVTACEYLRVIKTSSSEIGWRPEPTQIEGNFIWGSTPFSIGLWVGGNVTPNRIQDFGEEKVRYKGSMIENKFYRPGAISSLRKHHKNAEGEPAQVLNCPSCKSSLALPFQEDGLLISKRKLYFVLKVPDNENPPEKTIEFKHRGIQIGDLILSSLPSGYYTMEVQIESDRKVTREEFDSALKKYVKQIWTAAEIASISPSRMGYFNRFYLSNSSRATNNAEIDFDFDIFCPSSNCDLNATWFGGAPYGLVHNSIPESKPTVSVLGLRFKDDNKFMSVINPFRFGNAFTSCKIPINAYTVDEQIYGRLPSILVSTVDKFARMPFESAIGSLFGNVNYYHSMKGFYRKDALANSWNSDSSKSHPSPKGRGAYLAYRSVPELEPPELIVQDELHLIEGPLGSLMGSYETAVDFLSTQESAPKLVASSATVSGSEEHIRSVFNRGARIFPPLGKKPNDRYFVHNDETDLTDEKRPGRIYIGVIAPGRGALTPLVRIYSNLLQSAELIRKHENPDPYWTLVGYFNAVRELSGARALYRQDIPLRISEIKGNEASRPTQEESSIELSGRTDSTILPSILEELEQPFPEAPDVLFTTSMFGTGVDIKRLSLMVVNGQPKTTSSYIQATGRVGRNMGGLVVTFYRASRPRDLSHYEYFTSYHKSLNRHVEKISVYPFASTAVQRFGGPVLVSMLRNMRNASLNWRLRRGGSEISGNRISPDIERVVTAFQKRSQSQPPIRRPSVSSLMHSINSQLDNWEAIADSYQDLLYVEYSMMSELNENVVLGDPQHRYADKAIVFDDVPQSMRDIEESITFQTRPFRRRP
jgi:hypothetical protein